MSLVVALVGANFVLLAADTLRTGTVSAAFAGRVVKVRVVGSQTAVAISGLSGITEDTLRDFREYGPHPDQQPAFVEYLHRRGCAVHAAENIPEHDYRRAEIIVAGIYAGRPSAHVLTFHDCGLVERVPGELATSPPSDCPDAANIAMEVARSGFAGGALYADGFVLTVMEHVANRSLTVGLPADLVLIHAGGPICRRVDSSGGALSDPQLRIVMGSNDLPLYAPLI